MVKRFIAPVAALILAFGFGMFVRNERTVVPTNDQLVAEDGTIVSIEDVPEVLQDAIEGPTLDQQRELMDALSRGDSNTSSELEIQYYESPFGFRFQYDSRLQPENSWIVLPGGQRVSAIALVRYVKEQHCGQSGLPEHCAPYLENPAIAFGVIGKSPKDVIVEHLGVFAEYLESVSINGITAAQYFAGVEGEGVVTILTPLKDKNQTLVIQYTYDTLFDSNKKNPDILTSSEQKLLVDLVLNTLIIQ